MELASIDLVVKWFEGGLQRLLESARVMGETNHSNLATSACLAESEIRFRRLPPRFPAWLREALLLVGIIAGVFVFLFWNVDQFSGGLHWENYDCAFYAGFVDTGRATARDLWQKGEGFYGFQAFPCAVYSLLNSVFHVGWGALGIFKINRFLAVWTVACIYILARVCIGRMIAVTTTVLLLGCPVFITHAFCGNYASLLNVAAGVPCAALFVWAHRAKNPFYLLAAAYLLSWSYLAAYVSFPILMLTFATSLIVAALFCRQVLFDTRWYLASVVVIAVSILANGALVSVGYCGQDPMFVVRNIETHGQGVLWPIWQLLGHGPTASNMVGPAGLQLQEVPTNVLNMFMEVFVRSSPAYQKFEPAIPASVFPFDHLGANLPGTPGIYLPVTMLLIVGLIGTLFVRRFELMVAMLIWTVLLLVISLVLSFQMRRLVIAAPFMAMTAAFGLSWLVARLFRKWPRAGQGLITLLPVAVLAYAARDMNVRFRQHLRTLQFNCYTDVGRSICAHVDPMKDVLVFMDKSVMFPTALYCETGFRPYRFTVMSEFYCPLLLASESGNLTPLRDETYSCEPKHLSHLLRYCNGRCPSEPFDVGSNYRDAAWQQFRALLLSENQKGHQLYLVASGAEEKSLEAASQYQYEFFFTELVRRKVGLHVVAVFGLQPSGHPNVIIFKLMLPSV